MKQNKRVGRGEGGEGKTNVHYALTRRQEKHSDETRTADFSDAEKPFLANFVRIGSVVEEKE